MIAFEGDEQGSSGCGSSSQILYFIILFPVSLNAPGNSIRCFLAMPYLWSSYFALIAGTVFTP